MSTAASIVNQIQETFKADNYVELHWEGSFQEYLDRVYEKPLIVKTAYQRLYDMILSYGTETHKESNRTIVRYKFFEDPKIAGKDVLFGLELPIMNLVKVFQAAAHRYGPEKRVILLHGPVGSAKSTIVRRIKKGLEEFTRTPEGNLFSYSWILENGEEHVCPMNEEPLHLLPEDNQLSVYQQLNEKRSSTYELYLEGRLCPLCRYHFRYFMKKYKGNWAELIKHIKVRRVFFSEEDRLGIGTYQPKDEKNQDSTELTGDINYRKIAEYGSDTDPRAFNFDGEFNIANRGVIEFIELLKLDVAFLYDLLSASQEHTIKPKKFQQVDIDEVIIGHTNEPEYKRLASNEYMEAFRDRTIKIDIPYICRLDDEIKIYEKSFQKYNVGKERLLAPHTIEIASMWSVLTRLYEPKKAQLTLLQKLKLYNGKTLPGFTKENVRELKKEYENEGMEGISPRYIQDKVSNALVTYQSSGSINPFMVLNELEDGLAHHSLISSEEAKSRFRELLNVVKAEYENIVKNEVQKAISADEEAIRKLCSNYVDNIKAYTQKEKVKNPYTGEYEVPNEQLMRSIEEKIDIPENRKDDFRREIMNYIGALAIEGKQFEYSMNERLQKALELKLFEDQKDTIKLTTLVSEVVDKDTQAKIDVVKQRLIDKFGYTEESATDVLNYVSSIFARGDAH